MNNYERVLIKDARRIPFSDEMIISADYGVKTETRRPIRFKNDGTPPVCSYGQKGTLLLVTGFHIFIGPDGMRCDSRDKGAVPLYRVDWDGCPKIEGWRSPMFMPKWSPTRFLMNEGVERVKLCDITEEQAVAEGIRTKKIGVGGAAQSVFYWNEHASFKTAVDAFENLWDSIYGERGIFFKTNPDVWRIQFRKIDIGVKQCS